LKRGADAVCEVVVTFELEVLDELEDAAVVLEDVDALDEVEDVPVALEGAEVLADAIVLFAETLRPDFGKETPIAPPTIKTIMTKIANAVVLIAGRSSIGYTILASSSISVAALNRFRKNGLALEAARRTQEDLQEVIPRNPGLRRLPSIKRVKFPRGGGSLSRP